MIGLLTTTTEAVSSAIGTVSLAIGLPTLVARMTTLVIGPLAPIARVTTLAIEPWHKSQEQWLWPPIRWHKSSKRQILPPNRWHRSLEWWLRPLDRWHQLPSPSDWWPSTRWVRKGTVCFCTKILMIKRFVTFYNGFCDQWKIFYKFDHILPTKQTIKTEKRLFKK